jgi:hypothetical protein
MNNTRFVIPAKIPIYDSIDKRLKMGIAIPIPFPKSPSTSIPLCSYSALTESQIFG